MCFYKADSDGVSSERIHFLQNKNKDKFPWALSYSFRSLAFDLCACCVGFESILKNLFVMVLVSIRTYTMFCFEKWFKDVFVNRVLKSVLKRGFTMVLISIRTYTKHFIFLKMF